MKYSLATSDFTASGSRILLIVSYSVTFFLFAALFNGASAPLTGNHGNRTVGRNWTSRTCPVRRGSTYGGEVNAIRGLAGLRAVELDEALSRACHLHARYLVTNSAHPKAQGLGAHVELEELPGYTAEGAKAASTSNIFWGRDIAGSVDLWMAGLYHRIPFLRPNLKRIGLGYEGEVVVMDVISGDVGYDYASVAYPADGQANVPTEFGVEIPNPLPKGAPSPAGYPITLQFPLVAKVIGVEAELTDSGGAKIEFHLSDPERPATSFPQQNTICLIPTKPLAANTTYKVSIKANVDGREVRKSWSFITREEQTRK